MMSEVHEGGSAFGLGAYFSDDAVESLTEKGTLPPPKQ
jgi:hypothetical protein